MPPFSRPSFSYALNMALALVVAGIGWRRLHPAPTRPSAPLAPAAAQARLRPAPGAANHLPDARRRAMIDRLRSLGVPNDVLALVARVDIETGWDARFAACHGATDKLQALQLEMESDRDAQMRAALGEAGFRQWDQKNMLWEAMSTPVDVTSAEAATIYGLKKALQQRHLELERARLDGSLDDTQVNAAYNRAYADYFQQLKSVLGDERYAKSQQLDDAFVAENLRSALSSVHPTDAQLQELLTIEQAARQSRLELDHQFQDDLGSIAYQDKLSALTQAQDQEYERVLGADAYQTYQKSQDSTYAEMKKYETHWGLDDGKVDFVYDAMKRYNAQVDEVKSQVHALQAGGQTVDWPAAQAKLRRLATETQAALQKSLGTDSFGALQRNGVLRFVQIEHMPGRS